MSKKVENFKVNKVILLLGYRFKAFLEVRGKELGIEFDLSEEKNIDFLIGDDEQQEFFDKLEFDEIEKLTSSLILLAVEELIDMIYNDFKKINEICHDAEKVFKEARLICFNKLFTDGIIDDSMFNYMNISLVNRYILEGYNNA